MKIERTTKARGDEIAAVLSERIELDGTYWLVPRQQDPSRFFITPAPQNAPGFKAMVGRSAKHGRITLLINEHSAVIMLGVTSAPL